MRYQKQEKIIGQQQQKNLEKKRVLIVGMGALGSVVSEMMVRAGVGTLYLMDGDLVETSNLHRQQLYIEQDIVNELPKVVAAEKTLRSINHTCTIVPLFEELKEDNARAFVEQVDIVIDGSDNLETRYLINDTCLVTDTPWVYGAASGTTGTYFTFIPGKTPCFRCVFGDMENVQGANCSTEGVLPSITHYVATMQFNEAMKYLTNNIPLLKPHLERMDIWQNQQMTMRVKKRTNCFCQSPQTVKKNPITKELFELRTLCGKEVIMAKLNNHDKADKQHLYLEQKLQEKNIPSVKNPYFQTAIIQNTKVRLFQDGRIYLYHTEKEKAKDILHLWIS